MTNLYFSFRPKYGTCFIKRIYRRNEFKEILFQERYSQHLLHRNSFHTQFYYSRRISRCVWPQKLPKNRVGFISCVPAYCMCKVVPLYRKHQQPWKEDRNTCLYCLQSSLRIQFIQVLLSAYYASFILRNLPPFKSI